MTVERIKIDAKRKTKRKEKDCTGNARKPSEMPTNRNKTTQFTNISII